LNSRPSTFFGLCFIDVTSTSTIANLLLGNDDATASIASVMRKPTPIVIPAPERTHAWRFGM
jgi:hypothetical protein